MRTPRRRLRRTRTALRLRLRRLGVALALRRLGVALTLRRLDLRRLALCRVQEGIGGVCCVVEGEIVAEEGGPPLAATGAGICCGRETGNGRGEHAGAGMGRRAVPARLARTSATASASMAAVDVVVFAMAAVVETIFKNDTN